MSLQEAKDTAVLLGFDIHLGIFWDLGEVCESDRPQMLPAWWTCASCGYSISYTVHEIKHHHDTQMCCAMVLGQGNTSNAKGVILGGQHYFNL